MAKEGEVAQRLAAAWYRYMELFPLAKRSDEFLYHIQKCQKILFDEISDKKSPYYQGGEK